MNSSRFSKANPPTPKKLILLKPGQIGGTEDVSAYIADIPEAGDIRKLTFRGPVIIETDPKDQIRLPECGLPIYDPNNDEILWPCHGGAPPEANDYYATLNSITNTQTPPGKKPPGTLEKERALLSHPRGPLEKTGDTRTPVEKLDDAQIPPHEWEKLRTVTLWRIGTHLSLVGIEYALLKTQASCRPSVMLDGRSTVTVGVTQRNNGTEIKPTIARRGGGGGGGGQQPLWARLPFNTPSSSSAHSKMSGGGDNMTLLSPSFPELEYLFCIRPPASSSLSSNSSSSGSLTIETIPRRKFAELGTGNRSITWRSHQLDTEFPLNSNSNSNANVPAIVLGDSKTRTYRLYLFHGPTHAANAIEYGYLPLRKDGSIDSYATTALKLNGCQKITTPHSDGGAGVQVLETEKRLLLLCDDGGAGVEGALACYVAAKSGDERAPGGGEWGAVGMEVGRGGVMGGGGGWGCVVPGGFE